MSEVSARQPILLDTRGVLAGRLFAYFIDIIIIFFLTIGLSWIIAVLGIVTFGLAWLLFPLLAGTGILYSAITIGGSAQATFGMRWLGLRVFGPEGTRVDWLVAAVHAIFFYISVGTFILWLLNVLTGLVRSDRRMLHDLLTGLTIARA